MFFKKEFSEIKESIDEVKHDVHLTNIKLNELTSSQPDSKVFNNDSKITNTFNNDVLLQVINELPRNQNRNLILTGVESLIDTIDAQSSFIKKLDEKNRAFVSNSFNVERERIFSRSTLKEFFQCRG